MLCGYREGRENADDLLTVLRVVVRGKPVLLLWSVRGGKDGGVGALFAHLRGKLLVDILLLEMILVLTCVSVW